MNVLVVGAGFAGAVHARELAEAGHRVTVIDRRPHIGGNAYDRVDETGTRVHVYGPHLFHTNNEAVVAWLSRFTGWVDYRHRVDAMLPSGATAPLPINRLTLEAVFGRPFAGEAEVRAFLASEAERIAAPRNAAEHLVANIGRTLTDLFFRPYTKKMWALDLEELDAAVVKRIPIRFDDNVEYFPDDGFQALPADGYTAVFERILDHERIEVVLSTAFDRAMEREADVVFNSMPIDEYFGFCEGDLPYRSIRFHPRAEPAATADGRASVLNFTDTGPFTRETYWRRLPGHAVTDTGRETVTREEPCDYRDNAMERYYPVRTSDGAPAALYARYKAMADQLGKVRFIGRCGTYQYLDMHQVINQSLMSVRRFMAGETAGQSEARG
jgi:UDP-galactopyranose mutase